MQPANTMETEYNNKLNDGHKREQVQEQQQQQQYKHKHLLNYDYLVIALGSETNFFGIDDMRKFNGIETVGELNDFVRETVRKYYKNIYMTDIRIIVVNAGDKILDQVDGDLGKWALQKLKSKGVECIMNTQAIGATADSIKLDNGEIIKTYTIIWSTGVKPSRLVAELACEHDRHNRIISSNHLEVSGYEGTVYAIGDCASITDPSTGNPYPPTAQHALREAKVAADNLIDEIKGRRMRIKFSIIKRKE